MGTEQLISAFKDAYLEDKKTPGGAQMIDQLVTEGLLQERHMRHYLIIKQFPELLAENDGHITSTVYQLSDRYDLSERQVQNVLYKYRGRYKIC